MKNFRSAIVLCGGKGTRLGVLGKKIPKAMIKIQGKEIIWYIIKILKRNRFNQIIMPLGYKGNMIRKLAKNKFLLTSVVTINTPHDYLFSFYYNNDLIRALLSFSSA